MFWSRPLAVWLSQTAQPAVLLSRRQGLASSAATSSRVRPLLPHGSSASRQAATLTAPARHSRPRTLEFNERAATVADMVTLTLAHPLSARQAEQVLASEVKEYSTGDKIAVRKDYALSIIQAGYAAGVNPADKDAVTAALDGTPPELAPNVAEKAVDGAGGKVKK